MRFQVPQFIDVEDKLFGPLTFRQFIYLAGGAGLMYVSYKIIPSPFSYLFVALFGSFSGALAFYKLNNQTFLEIMQAWLRYQFKGKLYIWRRIPQKIVPVAPVQIKPVAPPKEFNKKTIDDLAKNLDILDHS